MNIVWDWSLESEADRLMEMSLKVSNGFYHLHHFLPLPYTSHITYSDPSHHVYLPDLPYSTIPHYWETVSRLNDPTRLPTLPKINKDLTTFLASLDLPVLSMPDLRTQSQAFLPKTVVWLEQVFPHLPLPSEIIVHPSYFGTLGSFFWDQKQHQITLYIRQDQNIYTLVEILLSAILRPHAGITLYSDWEKTEYLVDYLLLESSLKNILPTPSTWTPTTIPPHYPQPHIDESDRFLRKLGIPNPASNHFSFHGNQIHFGDTALTNFTQRESAVMSKLIESSPLPVTTDQIGDLIFTQDDKFSLAAINKTIERLRKKLSSLGISSSYLATASGVGYYLKN